MARLWQKRTAVDASAYLNISLSDLARFGKGDIEFMDIDTHGRAYYGAPQKTIELGQLLQTMDYHPQGGLIVPLDPSYMLKQGQETTTIQGHRITTEAAELPNDEMDRFCDALEVKISNQFKLRERVQFDARMNLSNPPYLMILPKNEQSELAIPAAKELINQARAIAPTKGNAL